ncbi:MAG: hypothetical protein ABIA04_04780 [Pseudomonadota bacterium]
MLGYNRPRLGQILLEQGKLNNSNLELALKCQVDERAKSNELFLGEILVKKSIITADDLSMALEFQCEMTEDYEIIGIKDKKLFDVIDREDALEHTIFPILLKQGSWGSTLYLAIVDKADIRTIEKIKAKTNCFIRPVEVERKTINNAINKYYENTK